MWRVLLLSNLPASKMDRLTPALIRSFFAGTELMVRGLASAGEWLPGAPTTNPTPKSIRIIAGIGRKP